MSAYRAMFNSLQSRCQSLATYYSGDLMHELLGFSCICRLGSELAELRAQTRVLRDMDVGRRHGDEYMREVGYTDENARTCVLFRSFKRLLACCKVALCG